jgi:hypothetical protein
MNNVMIGAVKKAAKKQPKHIFEVSKVIGISEKNGYPILSKTKKCQSE